MKTTLCLSFCDLTKTFCIDTGMKRQMPVQGEDIWWFEQYSWALFKVS
jgi:hypothetical protein